MEMREHGMLQSDPCFLLQGLEGFRVVVLPEVFQAQADGLLFTVLSGKKHAINPSLLLRETACANGVRVLKKQECFYYWKSLAI